VRSEPCTSSFILGVVEPGDTVLATRERSGSWMKLADWDEKGDCWIFRGDEDDLFEFVPFCDTPSVCVDSDASSDDFDWSEDESSGSSEFDDDDAEEEGTTMLKFSRATQEILDAAANAAQDATEKAAVVLEDWAAVEAAIADATVRRKMRGKKVNDFFASSSQVPDNADHNAAWADTFDDKSRNAANRWVMPTCYCGDCLAGVGHEHFTARDSDSEDSSDQSEDDDDAEEEGTASDAPSVHEVSAAPNCGLSESDDDDAEEEGTASDAPSIHEDSDASSDDEETETGEGDSDESDAADSSDAFLGASCECEARGRRKSHDCSMDYSQ
jgi:hypothetical protein